MRKLLDRFVPFIFLGIVIVALVAGLVLFSYLLIFGAIVGMVLFAMTWIRDRFFPKKDMTVHRKPPRQGQTYDHDDK